MSRIIFLSGIFSAAFWSLSFVLFPFREPAQVAVIGQFSPWKGGGDSRYRWISIGRSTSMNQIAVSDYRASQRHAVLFSKGGEVRDYAKNPLSPEEILSILNHRVNKRVELYSNWVDLLLLSEKKLSIWRKGEKREVGRYRFRGGEVISVPLRELRFDPCNSSELRRALAPLGTEPDLFATGSKRLELQIFKSALPFSLEVWQPSLKYYSAGGRGAKLGEFSIYSAPDREFELAFIKGRWAIRKGGKGWRSLPINWRWRGKGVQFRYERVSSFKFGHVYRLKVAGLPCYWRVTSDTMAGGLDLGRRGRLYFKGRSLMLKSSGFPEGLSLRELFEGERFRDYSVRVSSSDGTNISLVLDRVFDGDGLSIGGYHYIVGLYPKGVGLFQERKHARFFLLSLFSRTPHYSPSYPIFGDKFFLVAGRSPVDGGEMLSVPVTRYQGDAFDIPLGPFVKIERVGDGKYSVSPLEDTGLYYRGSGEKYLKVGRGGIRVDVENEPIFFSGGIFFKLFRPSYWGLGLFVALLWAVVATFGTWQFSRFVGRLAGGLSLLGRLWLFAFPLALFLNGLGLYVLSYLSLSSRGINNMVFLDRQLFWSIVGVTLFILIVNWEVFLTFLENSSKSKLVLSSVKGFFLGSYRIFRRIFGSEKEVLLREDEGGRRYIRLVLYLGGILFLFGIGLSVIFGLNWKYWFGGIFLFGIFSWMGWEISLRSREEFERVNFKIFALTIFLLGFVPILGLFFPPLVHNRFFLKIPFLGTVKLSEFAVIPAIIFFARFLGQELFWSRYFSVRIGDEELEGRILFWDRMRAALLEGVFYLLLLGVIGILYTVQGDLGPGLIFTLSFSLFLLYSSLIYSGSRGVLWTNLIRIGSVFFGLSLLFLVPFSLNYLFPEWASRSDELQKILQRVQLWHQPWRYIAGEQLLFNLWNLTGYGGGVNWFPNLHSDFIFTAVIGILGPIFGVFLGLIPALFALLGMLSSLELMPSAELEPVNSDGGGDKLGAGSLYQFIESKSAETAEAVAIVFSGLYIFSQNAVHLGSVLGLTPMTGVTYSWVSSGGSSLIACYLLLGISMRIFERRTTAISKNFDGAKK